MSSAHHQETGEGWRVRGHYRDNGDGKYRVQITHPSGHLNPRQVDALIGGLRQCQIALKDRDHPDTIRARQLERQVQA